MERLEALKFKIAQDITKVESVLLAADVEIVGRITDLLGKVEPDQFEAMKHDYHQALALMCNKDFQRMVVQCRAKFKLKSKGETARISNKLKDQIYSWLRNEGIYAKLNVSSVVLDNIINIMVYNTFLLQLRQPIELVVDRDEYADLELDEYYVGDIRQLSIIINAPITKNRLQNFIEDNWDRLSTLMKEQYEELNEVQSAYISERDMRVVALRDNDGLTFTNIADMINDEFKSAKTIGEDNAKTAYYDAKKKIESLYNAANQDDEG